MPKREFRPGCTRGRISRRRAIRSSRVGLPWRRGECGAWAPGQGNPGIIPEATSDFIFASIGEEIGLVGVTALLIAYLLITGSGLRVAVRSQRSFSKLLATGLSLLLAVQVFVVVGGITRLIPVTGITLPFVSYGGSSLVSNYILLAILLRISNDNATEQALAEEALARDPSLLLSTERSQVIAATAQAAAP